MENRDPQDRTWFMKIDSIQHWERGHIWIDDSLHEDVVEYYNVGDPDDPRLVFVHGWGLSPTSYRHPINAIAEDGWYVTALTLPGFGGSTPVHTTKNMIPNLAERLAEALTQLGHHPAASPIVAHSLGCGIAAEIAHTNPELAESLTLICPIGAAGSATTSWAQMFLGLRKEIGRDTLPRVVDSLPNMIRHPLAVASSGIAAKHADMIDKFKTIAVDGTPIHVVLADGDGIIAKEKIDHLYGSQDIKVSEVQGSHGWMLHNPHRVPKLVEETQLMTLKFHKAQ